MAILHCELTMDFFILRSKIERACGPIFEQEVLRTVPDEIVFAPRFTELRIGRAEITVTDKFGDVVYGIDAENVAA